MVRILDKIEFPEDLNNLSSDEAVLLCDEIRELILETVSKNGGHLASNLGVVELTTALHSVFNASNDTIVFDVGHQCYAHKILTGRKSLMNTLRSEGGISGFPKPSESVHDPLIEGHCGTAFAGALGIAKAKVLRGDSSFTVAVIGDGAFSNGMVYEALNNVDCSYKKLIVVLNDNERSISKPVGGIARYLLKLRTGETYLETKRTVEALLKDRFPLIGKPIYSILNALKKNLRNMLYGGELFEEFGLRYIGPVDGHDVSELTRVFRNLLTIDGPTLIHVITKKGKGYGPAESNPGAYHGVSSFAPENEVPDITLADCYSNVFGHKLSELASTDDSICAITAAMKYGTGLNFFAKTHKDRFFDVGIAEEHAVTFASGLAHQGMKPVVAIYSTFLQRGYDQLFHDVALSGENVLFAVDRAGVVGEDGETHHGLLDAAIFSTISGIRVISPSNYSELIDWTDRLIKETGPRVVRYPRGKQDPRVSEWRSSGHTFDLINPGHKTVIVCYGRIFAEAVEAAEQLFMEGISVSLLKLNQIVPIPEQSVLEVCGSEHILFLEEGILSGGINEHFCRMLMQQGYLGTYTVRAVNDIRLPQATVSRLLEHCGLNAPSIVEVIKEAIK